MFRCHNVLKRGCDSCRNKSCSGFWPPHQCCINPHIPMIAGSYICIINGSYPHHYQSFNIPMFNRQLSIFDGKTTHYHYILPSFIVHTCYPLVYQHTNVVYTHGFHRKTILKWWVFHLSWLNHHV